MIKQQIQLFFTALMFYTRIPVPRSLPYSHGMLNRATRYFPFIGWIVGICSALVFVVLNELMSTELAVLMSMFCSILLTGAFHEDGFADFCDGFGGGMTRERILEIMKDSRLGTYGVIGLIGILTTKFFAVNTLIVNVIPFVMVVAHALSRVPPVVIIFTSRYVGDDKTGKSKPVGERGTRSDLIIAIALGVFPAIFLPLLFFVFAIPVLALITFLFRRYIIRHLRGYTGDCLGALQQISEVAIYLTLVVYQAMTL